MATVMTYRNLKGYASEWKMDFVPWQVPHDFLQLDPQVAKDACKVLEGSWITDLPI